MKRLLLALLFALPAMAGPHDWTVPRPIIPVVRTIELDPPQVNTFCPNNLTCTVSAAWTFGAQIISTVSTGTAALSVASTTVIPNLNAQLHNGLTAPASAIVGISDTQSLTNKNLTTATSGNTVTLLCSAGPSGAITGNAGVQNIFSCSIPASAVGNLKAIRISGVWNHSTGTAAVTYGMTLNGQQLWGSNNSAATVGNLGQIAQIIETGTTTGNANTAQGFFSFTATTLTGLAWTSSQTLSITFNVANTDAITPVFFLVELIQ